MGTIDCTSLAWFVARTKPNREDLAHRSLGIRGIDVFLPRIVEDEQYASLFPRLQPAPLFPGYLFVRMDLAADFPRVIWAPGIRELLCLGGGPVPVDDRSSSSSACAATTAAWCTYRAPPGTAATASRSRRSRSPDSSPPSRPSCRAGAASSSSSTSSRARRASTCRSPRSRVSDGGDRLHQGRGAAGAARLTSMRVRLLTRCVLHRFDQPKYGAPCLARTGNGAEARRQTDRWGTTGRCPRDRARPCARRSQRSTSSSSRTIASSAMRSPRFWPTARGCA